MRSRGGAREGAGRPKKAIGAQNVSVRLNDTTVEIMKRHADFAGVSLSMLAARAIAYGEIKAYEELLHTTKTK